MNPKTYSAIEQELVSEWFDKWVEFGDLLFEVFQALEPFVSPLPSDEDEIRYQALRFWFIEHQARFVPLWDFFQYKQEDSLSPADDEEDIAELYQYLENPFLYFYEPENLYRLAKWLELQGGDDIWEPSDRMILHIMTPMIISLGQMMAKLVDVVSEPDTLD